MSRPTVSACIAVWNGADLLPRAIQSVLDQTLPPDEIIVLDDGSTDNSLEVARSYPGVRAISQSNAGIGAARRRLVEEARCDWIAFNDHDDWWHASKLERLSPFASDPDATLIYSAAYFVDESGAESPAPIFVPPDAPRLSHLLVNHSNILVPATLLRRQTLLDVGNYSDMRIGEDTLAFYMLMSRGKVIQVPERLAYIFKRKGSTSWASRTSFEHERAVYTEHLLPRWDELFGSFPASEQDQAKAMIQSKLAHLESVIAAWCDWEGDHRQAIQLYRSSFSRAPAAKGNLYRFLRSMLRMKVRPPGA